MSAIRDHLGVLPPLVVLILLGLSVTGEVALVIGMVLPGTTALLVLGFFASTGFLSLPIAVSTALVASIVGTTLGYLSGRRLGPRARTSGWGARVGAARWVRAERIVARFGGRAVFFGQFIVVARTLLPRLAGMNGQSYGRFAVASAPAVAVWAPGFTLAGYLAGASYEAITRVFGSATTVLLVGGGTALLLVGVGRWVARHPQPVYAAAAAVLGTAPARALAHRRDRWTRWLQQRANARGARAVNLLLVAGIAIALATLIGFIAAWIATHSGLPGIDRPVAAWMRAHRDYHLLGPALITVSVLRTSLVLAITATMSLLTMCRSARAHVTGPSVAVESHDAGRPRLVDTVGVFVALAILAAATDQLADVLNLPTPNLTPGAGLFSTQISVITAAASLTAWHLGHTRGWSTRTALWTATTLIALALAAARIYTGFATLSSSTAALLLGAGWALLLTNATAQPPAPDPEGATTKT